MTFIQPANDLHSADLIAQLRSYPAEEKTYRDGVFFTGMAKTIQWVAADRIEQLERENAALRLSRLADIDLSISFLGQVHSLIEEGDLDKAADFCRGAAETWAQDIAELEADRRQDGQV